MEFDNGCKSHDVEREVINTSTISRWTGETTYIPVGTLSSVSVPGLTHRRPSDSKSNSHGSIAAPHTQRYQAMAWTTESNGR